MKLNNTQKRWLKDAIRDSYDAGYNDARKNSAVLGDSAPGYRGREIERTSGDHYALAINNCADEVTSND